MKSTGFKFLVVAVILVLTASGAALACAGTEICRMPCCRASAGGPDHQDGGAGRPGCCESEGAGITACSPAAVDAAPAPESHLVLVPALLSPTATTGLAAAPGRARPPGRTVDTIRQKIPRYIHIRVLQV